MAYDNQWTERSYLPITTFTQNGNVLVDFPREIVLSQRKAGQSMPQWRSKIAAGQSASTPYISDRRKVLRTEEGMASHTFRLKSQPGTTYVQVLKGVPVGSINWASQTNHLSTDASATKSVALSKTYKKLQSEFSHLNSPAVIAEFLDVIRQFGSPAEALVDLTNRHLNRLELERRGLRGSVSFKKVKWAQVVASSYLEWSFGLSPLIDDTVKAAEALARWQYEVTDSPKLRARISSRAQAEASTSVVGSQVGYGNAHMTKMHTKIKTEGRYQYVCGLKGDLRADVGSNERLVQLLGFDHANWIPGLWEAVPWSWLADYFLNVQQILDAGVTNTGRVEWIVETYSQKSEFDFNKLFYWGGSTTDKSYSKKEVTGNPGGRVVVRRVTVDRKVLTSLPVPPLYFKHPFEEAKKLANLTALLFSRKPGNSALWLF